MSVSEFKEKVWVKDGIFSDFVRDDFKVFPIPSPGEGRFHIPSWNAENCINCKICINNCPQSAIEENDKIYKSNPEKCIGCGICSAVCSKKCWTISDNRQEIA